MARLTNNSNKICPRCGTGGYVRYLEGDTKYVAKCTNCNHYITMDEFSAATLDVNQVKLSSTTSNGTLTVPTTPTSTFTTRECGSRLPCGLCLITNSPCPYQWQGYEITWGTGAK